MLERLISLLGGEAKTVAFAIISGVAGFLAKGAYDVVIARRKDRLERVNQQLKLLYGPLYALDRAGSIAWAAFRSKVRPGVPFFSDRNPPAENELQAWRRWMLTVFKPQHDEMMDILTRNADLLLESEMTSALQMFCAHVAAYKVVFEQWKDSDFSQHLSVIEYPTSQLAEYLEASFSRLKAEQSRLLGHNWPKRDSASHLHQGRRPRAR